MKISQITKLTLILLITLLSFQASAEELDPAYTKTEPPEISKELEDEASLVKLDGALTYVVSFHESIEPKMARRFLSKMIENEEVSFIGEQESGIILVSSYKKFRKLMKSGFISKAELYHHAKGHQKFNLELLKYILSNPLRSELVPLTIHLKHEEGYSKVMLFLLQHSAKINYEEGTTGHFWAALPSAYIPQLAELSEVEYLRIASIATFPSPKWKIPTELQMWEKSKWAQINVTCLNETEALKLKEFLSPLANSGKYFIHSIKQSRNKRKKNQLTLLISSTAALENLYDRKGVFAVEFEQYTSSWTRCILPFVL